MDSIKVVAGSGGKLFITDNHHRARSMCCTRRAIRAWSGLLASGCDDPHAPFEKRQPRMKEMADRTALRLD
jgi:hypothetical protein